MLAGIYHAHSSLYLFLISSGTFPMHSSAAIIWGRFPMLITEGFSFMLASKNWKFDQLLFSAEILERHRNRTLL